MKEMKDALFNKNETQLTPTPTFGERTPPQ